MGFWKEQLPPGEGTSEGSGAVSIEIFYGDYSPQISRK